MIACLPLVCSYIFALSSNLYAYACTLPVLEWRDACIASSGMPMSACSYFQFEEFPAFMTVFYVSICLLYSFQYSIYLKHLVRVFWAASITIKRVGIAQICSATALEKSPHVKQVWAFRGVFSVSLFFGVSAAGYMFFFSFLLAPGFGLLNSLGSSKLYLGSLWNAFPIPEYAASDSKSNEPPSSFQLALSLFIVRLASRCAHQCRSCALCGPSSGVTAYLNSGHGDGLLA